MSESHPFGLKENNVTYSVPLFIAHILKQECMEALLHWKPASAKQFHDRSDASTAKESDTLKVHHIYER
jgi:hypothetical protein